jgi:hypothetical protein
MDAGIPSDCGRCQSPNRSNSRRFTRARDNSGSACFYLIRDRRYASIQDGNSIDFGSNS